ncbi:GNAT family N-acetyltransferase [Pontiella sp.]|uniref:GNAT family N-acetyltransferase n=1 Tax=Pontiella sp. TaxID=2837462 RepID=UPI0035690922
MDFYSSDGFLEVLAKAYYPEDKHSVELVRAGDKVLRLLVLNDRDVIRISTFYDYIVPVSSPSPGECRRSIGYAERVVLGTVSKEEWFAEPREEVTPAPYIDWAQFPDYEAYLAYIKTQHKRLLGDYARRRRRLCENHGVLTFCAHDDGDDVLPLAREWKVRQLIRTGADNYYDDERNSEFLSGLQQRGLLSCSTLRADGRLLAVWVGFVHGEKWSGWVFTYDPDEELKKYSLGHQLLQSMIRHSFEAGHREFDFSIGGEDYKWIYSTHARLLGAVGRQKLSIRLEKRFRSVVRKTVNSSPALRNLERMLRRPNETYV